MSLAEILLGVRDLRQPGRFPKAFQANQPASTPLSGNQGENEDMAVSVTGSIHKTGTLATPPENEDDAGMSDSQKLLFHEPLPRHTTEHGMRNDVKQLLEQIIKICGKIPVAKVNPFPHPSS